MNFEVEIIRVFNNTTNSYKYYWWYSILRLIRRENKSSFELVEIAFEMLVLAWYPVNYYKISLGKQDQLAKYIKDIKNHFTTLNEDIKEDDLFLFLYSNKDTVFIKNIILRLIKYVPYRFIRPWFDETNGVEDSKVNSLILCLQNNPNNIIPYTINIDTNEIVLNPRWYEWIYSNIKLMESFTLFELFKYVEKNNPYTSNISLKLFKPQNRKLSEPTKLWRNFIDLRGNQYNSVFDNKPLILLDKIEIDHYLPWSLVTHDKLWNLHPVENEINCSKGNKIADSKYLSNFTNLQFEFVRHLSSLNAKYLVDYFVIFSISKNELLSMSSQKFNKLLSTKISIDTELAINLGFTTNWSNLGQD